MWKNCKICVNISKMDLFASTVTIRTYNVNHKLDCDDMCLTYKLTCNQFRKQYVGGTTNSFRYMYNDHKFTRNETCIKERVLRQFDSEDHKDFLENISITLIDKTDGSNPKRREDHWRRTLNIGEEHWRKPMPTLNLVEDSV